MPDEIGEVIMTTWNNIPGVLSVELASIRSVISEYDGDEIPALYGIVVPDVDEFVIKFVSSGHYQPMSMYGGPDRLGWPEERSDERSLVRAYLTVGRQEIELPLEVQQQLFEHYREEIQDAELDDSDSLGGVPE